MTTNRWVGDPQLLRVATRRPGRPVRANRCQQCAARASALCGSIGEEAADALSAISHRIRVPEGRAVLSDNPHARSFAIITSGVVKLMNARPDGQHQIVGLQFPSDFVGRPYAQDANLIAEAATDLELCCFSGKAFEELLVAQPQIENALLRQVLKDLDVAREWMFLLGRSSAQEKVCQFLLTIATRVSELESERSFNRARFALPLSRTEIANCLGLRIETISRQLSHLKAAGVVSTGQRRQLEIRDVSKLKMLANQAGD